jgi:hypothetical protein
MAVVLASTTKLSGVDHLPSLVTSAAGEGRVSTTLENWSVAPLEK